VIELVVPARVHGFAVSIRLGPYPADAPHSHRRALYAVLTPTDEHVRRRMHAAGQQSIVGMVALAAGGAEEILREPNGTLAEFAATQALAAARRLAQTAEASA
jgi:hypothetical protein